MVFRMRKKKTATDQPQPPAQPKRTRDTSGSSFYVRALEAAKKHLPLDEAKLAKLEDEIADIKQRIKQHKLVIATFPDLFPEPQIPDEDGAL
jgi:hypothetical protein